MYVIITQKTIFWNKNIGSKTAIIISVYNIKVDNEHERKSINLVEESARVLFVNAYSEAIFDALVEEFAGTVVIGAITKNIGYANDAVIFKWFCCFFWCHEHPYMIAVRISKRLKCDAADTYNSDWRKIGKKTMPEYMRQLEEKIHKELLYKKKTKETEA